MNTVLKDWQVWRESWSSPDGADLDPAEARDDITSAVRREHRRIRATKVKLGIVSGVALLAVSGALLHEARIQDLVFAAILLAVVIMVAILELESSQIPIDISSKPTHIFVGLSMNRVRRELRMARLILLLVLTELGFFLQWWIGGIRIHQHEPFAAVVIFTGWLPLFGVIAVLIWIALLNARVRNELHGLTTLLCEED
ncbi:MAG TPA: hypothetical protein VGG76_06820 [Gemmatimonadaceae bacterium]|jgi:hypothetical protein